MNKEEYKRQTERRNERLQAIESERSWRGKFRGWFKWWWTPSDRFAFFIALFTAALALVAYFQLSAMRSTDEAIHRQLSAIEADERPWMKVEKIEPLVHPLDSRIGGLRFSGPNTVGFLPLHFLLKNVGRAPALNIRVGVGQIFGYPDKIDDLAKIQEEQCKALDVAFPPSPLVVDNTTFIRIIFPGDEASYDSVALAVLPQQIDRFSTGDPDNKVFQLWFYGCVRYTYANSTEAHQTSFAYRVAHTVDAPIPGGKAMDVSFKPWEDIPADRIVLEPRPMTAGKTN
jgi:hypothetical protein